MKNPKFMTRELFRCSKHFLSLLNMIQIFRVSETFHETHKVFTHFHACLFNFLEDCMPFLPFSSVHDASFMSRISRKMLRNEIESFAGFLSSFSFHAVDFLLFSFKMIFKGFCWENLAVKEIPQFSCRAWKYHTENSV